MFRQVGPPLLLPVSLHVSSPSARGPVGWCVRHSHPGAKEAVSVSGQGCMALTVPPPGFVLGTTWALLEPSVQGRR